MTSGIAELARELAPGSNPTHAGRGARVSARRADGRLPRTRAGFRGWRLAPRSLFTLAWLVGTGAVLSATPSAAEEPAAQRGVNTAAVTAAVTTAATTAASATPAAPAPARVEQSLLLSYLADKTVFTLVDARSPEEFLASHVDGAINLPLDRVAAENPALPAALDEPIVVYCKTGKRAAAVAQALATLGYANVRVLPSEQLMFHDDLVIFNCSG